MTDPVPTLQAENVVAGYGDLDVLHDVTIEVRPGEVVCMIGPNGAGKSTLLKAIFGLVPLREGHVRLQGQDITGLPTNLIVARGLGYVPQVANVFPNLTIDENLDMGGYLRSEGVDEAKDRVYKLFPVLDARADERVGRLSGGQRQMVAIGRALMLDPHVLLLDEPTAGLAPNLQETVLDQVRRIAASGTPVLVVEQNARKVLARADRAYVMDQGRSKFEGAGPALLADERIGRLYLGG